MHSNISIDSKHPLPTNKYDVTVCMLTKSFEHFPSSTLRPEHTTAPNTTLAICRSMSMYVLTCCTYRPAAAGTSGGGAAAQGARGDKQRAIPHVVIVSCKEVKLAAIRGKSSLKHKAPGFYLEPRRNQQQQRLYKQMRAVWTDLRRKGSDTRWVRDGNGVEVGLERRVGKEGPWQRVAMPTKQDAAERGPPAQPAAAKPPQPAAAAAAIPPPRGSKDGKSQKQRQRSQSTAARGRSSTRQQHQNEAAASRGKGKQREQQQQQAMQQAAAADGAAVRKEAGSRATTGAAGKGKAIGNSNTCEIEPASPT